jgi:hypothetical protein
MIDMANEARVFIAGSRRLSRLNPNVRDRIDKIIDKGLTVIVGDANGVDKSVQRYLSGKNYANVIVFCMEGGCRNNIGGWPTRVIRAADPGRRDFAYYSAKDRAMTDIADYGLMIWDGQSRGTLTNIVHLVQSGKPVVVYVGSNNSFHILRQRGELVEMLMDFDPELFGRIDRELQAVEAGAQTRRKVDTASLF